ncbi:zinc finger protein 709-like isoform X2 [Coccinella septempunctata]|uniref:zinc finger protein 709-like isoform X2 n=1 Tax=Coccinella septempunctata TaxID=41139 RepID=UPI001D087EE8|nr:zinc finger protein 709-like isoform X2 [Coccinella septempunctata]
MEESFSLTWEDSGAVVQNEEVIYGTEETEILPGQTEEFQGTDVVVSQNGEEIQDGNIMYFTEDNVLVMQESNQNNFAEHFMDCQVTEEVVTEQWEESCPEEIVVGSEEAVGLSGEQASTEDVEIPLPTDQDEYTAARPYPCDFCSRRFRKKANLMNHMVAHQTDRPHGCNLCGVRYIRKCDLMNHLKIHAYIPEAEGMEPEEQEPEVSDSEQFRKSRKGFNKKRKRQRVKEEFPSYETDEMAATSSRSYYSNEEMLEVKSYDYLPAESGETTELKYPVTDHRKPFVCQHCGVGFAREKALASHARIHGGDSPFECQKCNEMFWDMKSMRDHWRTKHGDMEDYDDDEDEDYSEEDHKYGTYYCTTCGISFHRQDNLKRHQRVHMREELTNNPDLGHICNVCGESFPEALELLAHAEVHARGSEHRCMICGEDFEDDQGCAVHVQEKHGDNLPPNTCMLCGRQCKDRRALLKHSWEHSKEKVFSCSKCAKTFHNKARLKRHMLSHRNKVVSCDVCGEEFPDGRTLMNHRHSHSNVSGRQFPCRECGKTFGSRSSQQIHIRIHTGERPYGCRFCWKAFADGGTLRKHERIHTGEKPYACAVCPRAFNQRVVLREHIRSHHSGPDPKYTHSMTPYCCSVCSDMFATSQDLIVHLIHHCDMNTAMKRQPQIGPRKYKRRRKLKPHEIDLLSYRMEDEPEQEEVPQQPPEYEIEMDTRRKRVRKTSPKREPLQFEEPYIDQEPIPPTTSIMESPPTPSKTQNVLKNKKKLKNDGGAVPSRPKMIHTQKTRVPIEPGEIGRVRHKTRTTITRTQPTEFKAASSGERIRPRTKNDQAAQEENNSNGLLYLDQVETPEVAVEQTIEFNEPVPTNLIRVRRKAATRQSPRKTNSLSPGRHIIGPGSKVRLVKSGMIVKKKVKEEKIVDDLNVKQEVDYEQHEEQIVHETPDEYVITEGNQVIEETTIQQEPESESEKTILDQDAKMKQEIMDSSPLHELAEISMQHAQSLFKCEMCSAVFSDRAQLLVHVPIHI